MSTLGGRIEELARARDSTLITITWVTGVLKVVVGMLALALVRPWGRRLPRRWVVLAAWVCAGCLTLYGTVQVAGVALAMLGVGTTTSSDSVLLWRLLLWEPWFLVWGLLLGLAARYAHKHGDSAR
ncbi:MAG: DUF3995 domain-containing protein [Solirubrobacteraceae bacterium]